LFAFTAMASRRLLVLLLLPFLAEGVVLDVRDFGAVGDGVTNNTAAFARAMAAVEEAGGGRLVVPPGRYLTGSIHLVSHLTLELQGGATLLYSPDPEDSPLVRTRWEGTTAWTHAPLLYALRKESVAVVGRGTLDGQGRHWWPRVIGTPEEKASFEAPRAAWVGLRDRIQNGHTPSAEDFSLAAGYLRPSLVVFYECRTVRVEGITLVDSPMWMLHPIYSEDVLITGARFLSEGPNNDGIDVDSCRNVRISDCFFDTGDDCIVLKSGRDADGRRVGRPTENVTITNCVMYGGHGAVVIGSEMSGDVRNVTASNIVSHGTDRGIRLKTGRGRGGVIENIRFDNWVIIDARREAIRLNTSYVRSPPEEKSERTPLIRQVSISNVTVRNARRVLDIIGLEEQFIEGIRISDLTGDGREGVFVQRVRDLELHDIRIEVATLPPFHVSDGEEVLLSNLAAHERGNEPIVTLTNLRDSWVRDCRALPGTRTFFQVMGTGTRNLRLVGNDLSTARVPLAILPGVPEGAVVSE
jgi:hypothetical protein